MIYTIYYTNQQTWRRCEMVIIRIWAYQCKPITAKDTCSDNVVRETLHKGGDPSKYTFTAWEMLETNTVF